jgi:hypothetical protein
MRFYVTGRRNPMSFGRLIWLMILATVLQYVTVALAVAIRHWYQGDDHYRNLRPQRGFLRALGLSGSRRKR